MTPARRRIVGTRRGFGNAGSYSRLARRPSEQSHSYGVYIGVFEQSVLLPDRSNKPWSFCISLIIELLIIIVIALIPLIHADYLPPFRSGGIRIGNPPKRLQDRPVPKSGTIARVSTGTPTRIFSPVRYSPSGQDNLPEPYLVDAPGPIGVDLSSQPAAISIDNLVEPAISVRPLEHTVIAPKPPAAPIRVSMGVQMAKLIKKVIPEYPPLAKTARISGVVHLIGTIARDGAIQNLQLIGGHPLLARAAIDAVRQWIYQPTLLNGEPVEVIAPIDVNFTLGQ